jgi:predicted RNA binding protein YcfA (HicA-like mRNA interferase family)
MAQKFRDVRRALRAAGWMRVRQTGSHEIWESPERSKVVTIAGKNSDTVPVGTLAAIRRSTGLEDLR